jgi:hypothetical protein
MTQEPDSSAQNSGANYDPVFEQLIVNATPDSIETLLGMIAYAEWKLDYPNSAPSQLSGRILSKYRKEAETILLDFAGRYADNVIKEKVQQQLNSEEFPKQLKLVESNLGEQIKANTINFWLPVWQSIVASIFFTFALFILALLIRLAAPDSNAGRLLQYLFAPDSYEIKVIPKK